MSQTWPFYRDEKRKFETYDLRDKILCVYS